VKIRDNSPRAERNLAMTDVLDGDLVAGRLGILPAVFEAASAKI
jgi:hypothetical protein